MSKQRFSVDVPESSLSQIEPGNSVTISFDSVRQVINGTVDRVIPTANPNSHSFNVKIALPLTTSTLISGMFGRLALPGTLRQGIGIPSTALIRRGQLEGVSIVGKLTLPIVIVSLLLGMGAIFILPPRRRTPNYQRQDFSRQ
jgi:HlyD family secretion protein